MFLTGMRTALKNRILANLNKYGRAATRYSDPFGKAALAELRDKLRWLPPETARTTEELLGQLEEIKACIAEEEKRITSLVKLTPEMGLLATIPGVGTILSVVIALEVGDIGRFPSAGHLASYSGTTPRVHSSGDKTRYGRLRPDVNRYLKWAFIEAANCVCMNHAKYARLRAVRRFACLAKRKGHAKAIGALARHLAEAAYHVLSRKEAYKDPGP
jgi:transposase